MIENLKIIDKPLTCFNYKLMAKERFPAEFNDQTKNEDFNLLFQENIDSINLKEILRSSTRDPNQAVRKFLWKRILLSDTSQTKLTIEKYHKSIGVLFGKNLMLKSELPDFVDLAHLTYYYLNDEGIAAVSRLLNVLASVHPDITFAPLLLPLASLFLHYMSEAECFACLLSVVESNNKITQTDIHWITTNNVFRRFSQKYSNASYDFLLESLYRQTNNPEMCFEVVDNWQWWIFEYLPFNYVLNIVDSFLLEGQKVLYRYGISILENFHKSYQCSNQKITVLTPSCIKDFCNKITLPFDRLVKTAFGFRNMSKKDIEKVFESEEKSIKKLRAKTETTFFENDLKSHTENDYKKKIFTSIISPFLRPSLIENMEIYEKKALSSSNINSHNLAMACNRNSIRITPSPDKNQKNTSKKWYLNSSHGSTHSFYHHHHPQANLNLPSFSVENIGSFILNPQQITNMWRWLPTRYQILELELIYSTNIHGCRLMTLMDKIEFYQATVIVIQTIGNSVFGAFCSQPWSNRLNSNSISKKPSFFGNGETFLFELLPNIVKYEWVGKHTHGQSTSNQELFLFADKEKIIIGGGNEKGVGLLINSDLVYGRTSVSDTFDNKILGTEQDFEIATLEVFSFKNNF